jgi:DNA-binding beta-propeller fold protein YncE
VVDQRTARALITNQQSGTLSMLDTRTGLLLRTIPLTGAALGPEPAPVLDEGDGMLFVVEDTQQGRLAVLDARTGAVRQVIQVGSYPQAAALDGRDGHLLVANHGEGMGGSVSLIEARTGRVLRTTAVPGSPVVIMIDSTTHRAFLSYDDSFKISMLDSESGSLLATMRVRADTDAILGRIVTPEPGSEHPPLIARIDEKRRWAIVDVPPILSDEGTERDSTQLVVLDSSTGGIVHTVPTMETAWPNAVAVDDRRGRAFTMFDSGIAVYDVSCITGRYNFANLG